MGLTLTKPTRYIKHKTAENAFKARRYAESVGTAFNLMVTVNWNVLGVRETLAVDRFLVFKAKLTRARKYKVTKTGKHYSPLTYLTYHENPEGIPHTHWLLSVPEHELDWFKLKAFEILKKEYGTAPQENALHFTENIYSVAGLQKYLSKGISPAVSDRYFVTPKDQGNVFGRRVSMSRNIGATRRKKSNDYR